MRTRSQNPFSTVTTSGLLLPIDLLARVADGDPDLKGLKAKDYHLRSGERLNEAAARAWNQCLAAWKSFRNRFQDLPESDIGTTTTRDEWLLPLFQELGYGRLQTKKALDFDGTEYPITHGWEDHVPIHLLSARLPLDRRTAGMSGAATRAPYSLVQELLNRSATHRWGFVTNGLKLFVLRDNAALARAANVEFDLEAMMDGEVYADFYLLFCLCHQSRVEIRGTGSDDEKENPEDCWLEDWANQADQQGTRAREKLRDGVESAIKALGAGFLMSKHQSRSAIRQKLATEELSTQDYYRQLLRLVYRLLLLLVAEEKRDESGDNLLHPPGTSPEVRDRYARYYGVGRVRSLAYERRGTAHTDLYESLKVLFDKLRTGYEPLGIPGMGSFLFSEGSTPDLDEADISNQDLLDAFRQLCYTEDTSGRGGGIRRPVDFGNLGSEELGSVYESLLELHPLIDGEEGPFTLTTAAGNERKTTGSYYTPTSLINCLLDSALDPVVHQAIDIRDPEEAERNLLDLKVCDPACGSGHFLIAAAERMATHLARLRTGDDQPNTREVQHAKRDIIGRCIYGVDMNPMAVELCKVSLWMEALDPGKPLSFLDHHVQCGNSLLGTTPALLADGIPNDAFKPIEGDVKTWCTSLKKRNKREREDRASGQMGLGFEPYYKLGNMPSVFAKLSAGDDSDVESIAEKERLYAELVGGANYLNARLLADMWCAAFVWKKDESDLGQLCPTESDFRKVENNPHSVLPVVKSEIGRLANQYQFFHWHLSFPDVFKLPDEGSRAENEHAGWNHGFDCVLGNPPWERINLEEKEWFATRNSSIAEAATGAARKRQIQNLKDSDPSLFYDYREACRFHDGLAVLLSSTARFPLCAKGRINTFAIFAELNLHAVNSTGRVGCIVPTGIATDDNSKLFFQSICSTNRLISLYDFENRDGIFPGVHRSYKFCLLTLSGLAARAMASRFSFFAHGVSDLSEDDRIFSLTADDITLLNPNTRTCPIFRNRRDADLTRRIYRQFPVLIRKAGVDRISPWGVQFRQGLFNMTSDSQHFRDAASLSDQGLALHGNSFVDNEHSYLPLYEAKMIHQFNHRHASIGGEKGSVAGNQGIEFDEQSLAEPTTVAIPRYWVDAGLVNDALPNTEWAVGFRDITRATDYRTWTVSLIPRSGVGNNLPLILFERDKLSAEHIGCFISAANAFATDFFVRQKIGGIHLNFYIVEQLALAPPHFFDSATLPSGESFRDWLRPRYLELIYTADDVASFAHDCGFDGPPFVWNSERRMAIRAEIDAAFFRLYGFTRDDAEYILSTFPVARQRDERQFGDFRTQRLILEFYDEFVECGWTAPTTKNDKTSEEHKEI